MKTTNRFLILMAIMSLLACKDYKKSVQTPTGEEFPITIYSKDVHVITLYVNTTDIIKTDSIEKDGIFIKPGLRKYADFKQADTISNEDYTTIVSKGDIIVWRGVSTTNSLDVVNIKSINHQGGPKLFDKNVLQGNGGDNEVVVGVITKGPVEEKEKYVLKFTVKKNGEPQIYSDKIDPYIKANQ